MWFKRPSVAQSNTGAIWLTTSSCTCSHRWTHCSSSHKIPKTPRARKMCFASCADMKVGTCTLCKTAKMQMQVDHKQQMSSYTTHHIFTPSVDRKLKDKTTEMKHFLVAISLCTISYVFSLSNVPPVHAAEFHFNQFPIISGLFI